jgi:hypothetical protein
LWIYSFKSSSAIGATNINPRHRLGQLDLMNSGTLQRQNIQSDNASNRTFKTHNQAGERSKNLLSVKSPNATLISEAPHNHIVLSDTLNNPSEHLSCL